MKKKKELIQKTVSRFFRKAAHVSDAMAEFAEPGFEEYKSSELLASFLEENGFSIRFPFPSIPTAFRADWGKKGTSIGLLAEYDALPDCGGHKGEWGHGCGHNLLGAAAALGGAGAKAVCESRGIPARITVWGCPAEELLAGKVYMAREGAFRDNDIILGWHPGAGTGIGTKGGSSLDSWLFEFTGKTAHGASAHNGRSALDAVMLMDTAVNYLREHVPDNIRIHMCIPDGGTFPNVVPEYATAWYYLRGKNRKQVDEIRKRLVKCAEGAALQTETQMKKTRLTGVYERCENDTLASAVLKNLNLFGSPKASASDKKQVKKLGLKPEFSTGVTESQSKQGMGSSDEDNVSWLAPFGRFSVSCIAQGTTGHHREYAAQVALPFAHRGMKRAAEVFAGTVYDLCTKPDIARKAKQEFRKKTKGFTYDPLISKRIKPSVFTELHKK